MQSDLPRHYYSIRYIREAGVANVVYKRVGDAFRGVESVRVAISTLLTWMADAFHETSLCKSCINVDSKHKIGP